MPNFADAETPSGLVDGINQTFTLAQATNPQASLLLILNGLVMSEGGVDYVLSGNTINFTFAPATDSIMKAFYRY